jgi:hypothetical protein
VDGVMDRLDLAIGAAGADHEVVGVADHPAQIELDDLERFTVFGVGGDGARDVFWCQRYIPFA